MQSGLNSDQYFAFASGFDGTRYIDLKFNQYVGIVERSGYLVKVVVAKKQLADDEAKRQAEVVARAAAAGESAVPAIPAITSGEGSGSSTFIYPSSENNGSQAHYEDPVPATPKNKRFYMTADLDTARIGRDVQKLVEEVISHLTSVDGTKVEVSLEVNVKSPAGLNVQTVRTVSENCRTLRVRDFGFEE